MKANRLIISLLLSVTIVVGEVEYQETDFYSRFAMFSYAELDAIGSKSSDADMKEMIFRNLAFVAYNYFMQVDSKVIMPNKSFENALRGVYRSHSGDEKRNLLYRDPLGWLPEKDATLSLPSGYMPVTRAKYLVTIENFVKFLSL